MQAPRNYLGVPRWTKILEPLLLSVCLFTLLYHVMFACTIFLSLVTSTFFPSSVLLTFFAGHTQAHNLNFRNFGIHLIVKVNKENIAELVYYLSYVVQGDNIKNHLSKPTYFINAKTGTFMIREERFQVKRRAEECEECVKVWSWLRVLRRISQGRPWSFADRANQWGSVSGVRGLVASS